MKNVCLGSLVSFFFKFRLMPRTRSEFPMFNLIQDYYIIKIDLWYAKTRRIVRKEFSRKRKVSVDGQDLYVVRPEDLILSKLEWAKDSKSEIQLRNVQNRLQSVKNLDRRT